MVWKFCEICKILLELASRLAKFCEILTVRYVLYALHYLILQNQNNLTTYM